MPRIGMNPSRGKTLDYQPARTTVAVLVYAPHKSGYFQNRLEVTRATIESILTNTQEPFDLLVFDNGSCPEMVDYLQSLYQKGVVDYLILSKRNIGKLNALNIIFNAAPGKIVAYTDDDVFFLPGWLKAHLEIIDTFPNVGAVTGFYIRERVVLSSDSTIAFANQPGIQTERGLLMPKKWQEEYMVNTGRSQERYDREVAGIEDMIVTYNGVEAWVSAHHYQMVCPKSVVTCILSEMLPQGWTDQVMGRMIEMDNLMDSKGYLRFCTRQQTVRLMGNMISEEVSELARKFGLSARSVDLDKHAEGFFPKLAKIRPIRFVLQKIENLLYRWLN